MQRLNQLKDIGKGLASGIMNKSQKLAKEVSSHVRQATAKRYRIGRHQIQEIKKLSEGGYAFVYLVKDVETDQQYALKKLLCQDKERLALAKREVSILKNLPPHKNIVGFIDSEIIDLADGRGCEVLILLELLPGGHLVEIMQKKGGELSFEEIMRMIRDICQAILHLHSQNPPVAHRDLKVENVLLAGDGNYKLCDFGSWSTKPIDLGNAPREEILKAEEQFERFTTLMYRPPEMADPYAGLLVNEKVDIWMLGCILFTLAFYRHPFQDVGALAIVNANYSFPQRSRFDEKFHDLIRWLLDPNPLTRPSITEVIEVVKNYRSLDRIPFNPARPPIKRDTDSPHERVNISPIPVRDLPVPQQQPPQQQQQQRRANPASASAAGGNSYTSSPVDQAKINARKQPTRQEGGLGKLGALLDWHDDGSSSSTASSRSAVSNKPQRSPPSATAAASAVTTTSFGFDEQTDFASFTNTDSNNNNYNNYNSNNSNLNSSGGLTFTANFEDSNNYDWTSFTAQSDAPPAQVVTVTSPAPVHTPVKVTHASLLDFADPTAASSSPSSGAAFVDNSFTADFSSFTDASSFTAPNGSYNSSNGFNSSGGMSSSATPTNNNFSAGADWASFNDTPSASASPAASFTTSNSSSVKASPSPSQSPSQSPPPPVVLIPTPVMSPTPSPVPSPSASPPPARPQQQQQQPTKSPFGSQNGPSVGTTGSVDKSNLSALYGLSAPSAPAAYHHLPDPAEVLGGPRPPATGRGGMRPMGGMGMGGMGHAHPGMRPAGMNVGMRPMGGMGMGMAGGMPPMGGMGMSTSPYGSMSGPSTSPYGSSSGISSTHGSVGYTARPGAPSNVNAPKPASSSGPVSMDSLLSANVNTLNLK
eukprot:GILJ01005817.1.p1 GENE.GILJ01005817.1~~GILJ01005817.1.p1  ORF type:complete len:873 (-),score=171.44 GILJ01005817.1:150-2768(-)